MAILDTFALHGILKKEDIPVFSRLLKEGKKVEAVLLEAKVSNADILRGKGIYYNLPIRDLKQKGVPFEILKYIPEDSATYYHFVPMGIAKGVLEIGITDPENIEARDALQFIATKLEMPFKIFLISDEDFASVIKSYRGITGEVTKALSELEVDLKDVDKGELLKEEEQKEGEKKEKEVHVVEDAPVAKITAVILRHATEGNASDVHIEHTGENVRVRFRVDGELFTSLILPVNLHSSLVARIKILASLKLDEKRKPQDGRFSARIDGRKIDFRVSTFPAYYGEKVVMRILDSQKGVKKLDELGLRKEDLDVIQEAIKRPYGIILITGPTGSGKSTTLYSMINELDKETRNIISLEDPVEYNMAGVSQSQVRPEIGYTFATGLRTTLRQDPDIIMVGEIRDKETAQLAIQAALTGHLVLSTIHTNNSIGVIPRLINMGVDPYLIAPTLKLALAQRLARRIKTGTGREEPINKAMELMMTDDFKTLPVKYHNRIPAGRTILHPEPTPGNATGLKGRIAVMEALEVSEPIQNLILKNASEEEIYNVARSHGFMSMKEDAIIKALDHIIPYEEMTVFGSKVGMDDIEDEENIPVNNSPQNVNIDAIIKNNENTNS